MNERRIHSDIVINVSAICPHLDHSKEYGVWSVVKTINGSGLSQHGVNMLMNAEKNRFIAAHQVTRCPEKPKIEINACGVFYENDKGSYLRKNVTNG